MPVASDREAVVRRVSSQVFRHVPIANLAIRRWTHLEVWLSLLHGREYAGFHRDLRNRRSKCPPGSSCEGRNRAKRFPQFSW